MKAIVYEKYGTPEVLRLEEIEKPTPGDGEVLVKIHAAAINFNSLIMVSGKPFLVRLMMGGLLKPKYRIPGSDIAGKVEAIGTNVKHFQPGDQVLADLSHCGFGAFAEYVCVPENALAPKPVNLSFEEAAAIAQAALVALQGLRAGQIRKGQKVLIYGASGGIGTFAVQIAKAFGAEVTGVCSTRNLALVRSIGADHVIDYTKEDFTKNGQRYDLILSVRGYRSIFDYKRALSPNGVYVMAGGDWAQIFQPVLFGPLVFMNGSKRLGNFTHKPNREDFIFMKELIEAGKVKSIIDRCYPLSDTPEALRYYGQGRARGKVVITVEPRKKS